MATLTSSLVVSLIDRVTAPARSIAGAIGGIGNAVRSANSRLVDATKANTAAVAAMRGKMLEAVATAYALKQALAAPLSAAGNFETAMLDIAQKSDLSNEAMKTLGERVRAIAPAVNKTASEVAGGIDVLTSMGLDPSRALAIIPQIGKAATAYRADMTDVAKMTYAAIENLKIPVGQTTRLLDVLSQAAKEGAFEFKDMAKYFPVIAAQAQARGQSGILGASRIGAAFEAIRKGVGDSEAAATNLKNIFQKMIAPDAVKNFAKFGINIRKEYDKAIKAGDDPLEMVMTQTMKALVKANGGKVEGALSRIGDLFQDAQVQEGLTALIQNWAFYRETQRKVYEATGVVEEDFKRRMLTFQAQVDGLKVQLEDLGITIGDILVPHIRDTLKHFKPMVDKFNAFSKANPEMVGRILNSVKAFAAFMIASTAARWAFGHLKGAVLLLLKPIAMVAAALTTLRGALMLSGIGMLLLAIGAAGKFIHDNWNGLGVFFREFGAALEKALGGETANKIKPLIDALKDLGGWITSGSWKIDDSTWAAWGRTLGEQVAPAVRSIVGAIESLLKGATEASNALDRLFVQRDKPQGKEPAATTSAPPASPKPGNVVDPRTIEANAAANGLPSPSPGRRLQQAWAGESDSAEVPPAAPSAPAKPSFWGQFTLANVIASTEREVEGIKAAYAAVTNIPGQIADAVDSYVEKRNAVIDQANSSIKATIATPLTWMPPSIRAKADAAKARGEKYDPTTEMLADRDRAEQPPQIIGVPPANENVPPAVEPRIETKNVDAFSKTIEGVANAMTGLATTTTPDVNAQPLREALALAVQLKAVLGEIGTVSAGVPGKLQAGGIINRQGTGAFSDYGSESGGGG